MTYEYLLNSILCLKSLMGYITIYVQFLRGAKPLILTSIN